MYKISIIILFLFYWFFAFYRGFEINTNIVTPIKSIVTPINIFFPPVYKMFIGPYKTKFKISYIFYKGNERLGVIDMGKYLQKNIREELPFSNKTFRIFSGVEYACYAIDISYQGKFLSLKQEELDKKSIDMALQKYVSTDVELKKNFLEIVEFHKIILQTNKNLKEATKVKVVFDAIPVLLDYENQKGYIDTDLSYQIGKKTIYEESFLIK